MKFANNKNMKKNTHQIDDGRRNMPKLRCPHCRSRLLDVSDAKLKNQSELKPLTFADHPDYVLKCPECKKDLALLIKSLHERRTENAVSATATI